ncbi:GNAT family N-acetyltransferase [Amycolatopsis viridis]|uniref:GNAT superfamily N-acetyltransferase n=1 Tax=Amycolatopsis viridis TaxID=185678 RepID=A0ABX0SLV2_9PSEU|nr:GNAT family N-acetyltransferase [Amycolatopsis viridis]NIH77957.1 GNAT superfamily N-acetyltransferase [Amycolatopsis viridis]
MIDRPGDHVRAGGAGLGAPAAVTVEDGLPTVAEYRDLRAAVGWPSPGPDACRAALENSVHGVLARDRRELAGMARLVGDGVMYLLIVDVVVHPGHQGRGLGRRMVRRLVELAGARRVQLVAAPEVVPFYEQLGFVRGTSHLMAYRTVG